MFRHLATRTNRRQGIVLALSLFGSMRALEGKAKRKKRKKPGCPESCPCSLLGPGTTPSPGRYWGCDLVDAEWPNANMSSFSLFCLNFERANLSGADFSNAWLTSADFSNANLSYANLFSVTLYSNRPVCPKSTFSGSNLEGTNLGSAHIRGVDFPGAVMRTANLANAYIDDVNFTDADLRGADLTNAYFEATNFTGADLSGATLTGTRFCFATMPDGSIDNSGCE